MMRFNFFGFISLYLVCTSLVSFSFQDPGEEIDEYQIRVNKTLYNVTLMTADSGPLNQSEATNVCSRRGFHLPVFYSLWEHNRFLNSSILRNKNINQFWLPQRRHRFKGFQWMDSNQHSKHTITFSSMRLSILDFTTLRHMPGFSRIS